jgi:hypothetical protein
VLACTELPIALAAAPDPSACLDATEALARACIDWHRTQGEARPPIRPAGRRRGARDPVR